MRFESTTPPPHIYLLPQNRLDGLGNTRAERIDHLTRIINYAVDEGDTAKVINSKRLLAYEKICLELGV